MSDPTYPVSDPNYPAPPASTGTWGESVEQRLHFVESVIRAGHAVGQQPGSGSTPPAPEGQLPKPSAKEYAENPPPTPPVLPTSPKAMPKPSPVATSGAYSASTTYGINEVVTFNGVRYKSLANGNENHTPNTSPGFWQHA